MSEMGGMGRDGREETLPGGKISYTFLDFAAPLLQALPADGLEAAFERALRMAYVVWNAVVYADVAGEEGFLRDVRRGVEEKPELAPLVEMLIRRKRARFGDDWRCIGRWEVTRTSEGLDVRADARDPRATSPRKHRPGRAKGNLS